MKFSKTKNLVKSTEAGSVPAIVFIVAGFINRKYNLGFSDSDIAVIVSCGTFIYYSLRNYIKIKFFTKVVPSGK